MTTQPFIPWEALGFSVPKGYTRTIVICADCNAPLGIVGQPPASSRPRVLANYFAAIARAGHAHRREHPTWSEPRVNLIAERDLNPVTLANLFGSGWAELLKGLAP